MLLLLGMILAVLLALFLFGTDLLGFGTNLGLRLRSVIEKQQQQTQQPVKPTQPETKRLSKAPAPSPPALPPSPKILTPTLTPQVVLTGQPQTYYNSWGWWLVDPNGSFHCPPMPPNPKSWTGGIKVLVQRDGVVYETWAPSCYR